MASQRCASSATPTSVASRSCSMVHLPSPSGRRVVLSPLRHKPSLMTEGECRAPGGVKEAVVEKRESKSRCADEPAPGMLSAARAVEQPLLHKRGHASRSPTAVGPCWRRSAPKASAGSVLDFVWSDEARLPAAASMGATFASATRSERSDRAASVAATSAPSALAPAAVQGPAGTFNRRWRRGKRLGGGAYGTVHLALDRDTGEIFAVKECILGDEQTEPTAVAALGRELEILRTLQHRNIVRYLGHERFGTSLCIFMEYMHGGSLASSIREFGPLDIDHLRLVAVGILQGLDHLHRQKPPIVHRDVKGANVLLGASLLEIKLADFGHSSRCSRTDSLTIVGSVPWMAPEVTRQQDGHGRKADIWSFGCTMIEALTAEPPWGKGAFDNPVSALRHIGWSDATPLVPAVPSHECQDLLERCLQRSPERRPLAQDALRHAFLQRRRQLG